MNDGQGVGPAPAEGGDSASANVAGAPPTPEALSKSKSSPWGDWILPVASSFSELLARPRLRLIATGAVLLLIGGLLVPNSVWTLPVVIIGAVMVAIGWVGGRLDGRFAVEWGQTGTQLEFRARIAAPSHERPSRPEPEIIDGTAHTVELELAELEALIVAAETPEAQTAATASTRAVQKLRVARGGEQPAESGAESP
jgi:hypothetical protein